MHLDYILAAPSCLLAVVHYHYHWSNNTKTTAPTTRNLRGPVQPQHWALPPDHQAPQCSGGRCAASLLRQKSGAMCHRGTRRSSVLSCSHVAAPFCCLPACQDGCCTHTDDRSASVQLGACMLGATQLRLQQLCSESPTAPIGRSGMCPPQCPPPRPLAMPATAHVDTAYIPTP
jgi:hypothetical protein